MRIFLAIDFPEAIKEKLLQEINLFKKSCPEFKWIKKPALHLTLRFIGEVKDSFVSEINDQIKEAFLDIDPFQLATGPLGFFPSEKRARVFYLDIKKSDILHLCYTIIEENLAFLGINKENRRFHPHITLARIKYFDLTTEQSQKLLNQNTEQMIIPVDEIILMQSELLAGGARYTAVQRFSLRKK